MNKLTLILLLVTILISCSRGYAQVGINMLVPQQSLDVNGKIRVSDDSLTPQAGTIRYDNSTNNFEGHDGSVWQQLNNAAAVYQDARLSITLGDTKRNSEQPWGDTITITEAGTYILQVSAYISSTINEEYQQAAGSSTTPYDNRGRVRIYLNGQSHKLLECGNGIIDKNGSMETVSFAPSSRTHLEVLFLNIGDQISLTRNMQAVPAFIPCLTIPDLWLAEMEAFFVLKLD